MSSTLLARPSRSSRSLGSSRSAASAPGSTGVRLRSKKLQIFQRTKPGNIRQFASAPPVDYQDDRFGDRSDSLLLTSAREVRSTRKAAGDCPLREPVPSVRSRLAAYRRHRDSAARAASLREASAVPLRRLPPRARLSSFVSDDNCSKPSSSTSVNAISSDRNDVN